MDENILWQQRETLTRKWIEAISPVRDFDSRSVLAHVTTLTEKVIHALSEKAMDAADAQVIGQALSELTSQDVRALSKTYQILGAFVLQAAPENLPRLWMLLCEISIGFHHFQLMEMQGQVAKMQDEVNGVDEIIRLRMSMTASMMHELFIYQRKFSEANDALQTELNKRGDTALQLLVQPMVYANEGMLRIRDDFFDATRIEYGELRIHPERFDIAEPVEEVSAITQTLVDEARLTLLVNCAEKIGSIYTDRMRLRQILINLMNNAIKFTPEGTITLSAFKKNQNGQDVVVFEVQDTGIGIAPERIPGLLTWPTVPLKLLKSLPVPAEKRETLGLPIACRLADLMGGSISIESELGKGSTFRLVLPVEYHPLES